MESKTRTKLILGGLVALVAGIGGSSALSESNARAYREFQERQELKADLKQPAIFLTTILSAICAVILRVFLIVMRKLFIGSAKQYQEVYLSALSQRQR